MTAGLGRWLYMARRFECVTDLAKKGTLVHRLIRADFYEGTESQWAVDRVFVELYQQFGEWAPAIKMPGVPNASDKSLSCDERSA